MSVTIHSDMFEAASLYEDGAGLLYALVAYAETGSEPDISEPWYPTFVAFRSRIRMSAEAHENGSKGGRPRKVENHSEDGFETQSEKGLETPCEKGSGKGLAPEMSRDEMSGDEIDDVCAVVEHLNSVCGTSYSPYAESTRKLVSARLRDYSVEDLKRAVSNMASHWKGDPEMERYLRPGTIFRASKFESYLNAKPRDDGFGEYGDAMADRMVVL